MNPTGSGPVGGDTLTYLYSLVRSRYSLHVQPSAMTSRSPQTRPPTIAAVMTLRGRTTLQLSSSVASLQSTWPSQRQLSNTHLQADPSCCHYGK